jgi:hypothetical protein
MSRDGNPFLGRVRRGDVDGPLDYGREATWSKDVQGREVGWSVVDLSRGEIGCLGNQKYSLYFFKRGGQEPCQENPRRPIMRFLGVASVCSSC